MPKRDTSWFWIVPCAAFEHMDAASIFDILRYDAAIVQPNAPDGYYLFRRINSQPNRERLKSRGIKVEDWQMVQGQDRTYELLDRARARRTQ